MDKFRFEEPSPAPAATVIDQAALVRLATIVYALQAASFFVGLTLFAAVIVNYVRRDDARGTWLESHFRWQTPHLLVHPSVAVAIGGLTFVFIVGWFILGAACPVADLPDRQGMALP